jgi:hypothetical protein
MGQQGTDDPLADVNPSVLPGPDLRLPLDGVAADLHELGADDKEPALKTDIGPSEAADLTAAEAGERQHLEQGTEPVLCGVVQERAQLGGLPGRTFAGRVVRGTTSVAAL